jgi:hypothetical protein
MPVNEEQVGNVIPGEQPVGQQGEQTEQTEEHVVSKWEEQARHQGWVPEDEWQGEPDAWRPAREFVERGELFSKISGQGTELKELRKALSYLVDHHKSVKETEFNRALVHLKNMKKDALVDGDPDKVVEVDEAISELKEQRKAAAEEQITSKEISNAPTQSFLTWVKGNQWYIQDTDMRQAADEIGLGYFQRNPGAKELDTYNYVLGRIKKMFPEKFEKKNFPKVDGGTNSGSVNRKSEKYSLTEDERKTMQTFVRSGVMTEAEYIRDLKLVKGEA